MNALRVRMRSGNVLLLLAKKNKSQVWMATQMRTSKQYLHQVIRGNRHPSPEMRERITAIFPEVPWETLFIITRR